MRVQKPTAIAALLAVALIGAAQTELPPATPTSTTPVARTDDRAVAREAECIRRAQTSEPVAIVFIGASIVEGWESAGAAAWAKHFAPVGALNLGNSGDRTEHVLWRLRKAPLTRLHPRHIVVNIGSNNLGNGTSSAQETLAGITAVVDLLLSQCPDATVHLLEVFPRGERFSALRGDICQVNQALRAWVASRVAAPVSARLAIHAIGDHFVEPDGSILARTMPDFLHPSPEAYARWAELLLPELR